MVTINNLILAGGGFKGIAYIGMYKYLEEHDYHKNINTIAGTSIGAFIGTLICMGYNSKELQSVILHFDYNKYHSIDLNYLFEKFGLDSSEKITKFIELLFLTKNYAPDITFRLLYEKTHIHLIMNATCLNTHESVLFDYIKTPNAPVIKGILASMAMPFLFSCVNHDDLIYSDGGVINNFLIDLPQFIDQADKTLGINVMQKIAYSIKSIDNIIQYTQQLLSCIHNICQQVATNKKPHPKMHIINLSSPEFGTFDFNMNKQDKLKLIDIGFQKTKNYFEMQISKKNEKIHIEQIHIEQIYNGQTILEQIQQLLLHNCTKEAIELIEKHHVSKIKECPIKESKPKRKR